MIARNIENVLKELPSNVKLVAVSKYHPAEDVLEAYDCGQRLFGENIPQELAAKARVLPDDISWHFIGHLQTNKLKLVLPYVSMVESIDSLHLLEAVNRWCLQEGKRLDVLLEVHVAAEESKQGLGEDEVRDILSRAGEFPGVRFRGLMGMATNTSDEERVNSDFARISALKDSLTGLYPSLEAFDELSIGMSSDWRLALRHGATIVRLGSALFGPRKY